MNIPFTKMHGLGNDFAVIDGTKQSIILSPQQIRAMADRRLGIGFDQLLLLEASDTQGIDFNYRIFNADGGEAEQCGNGARCIARFIREHGLSQELEYRLKTLGGVIKLQLEPDNQVTVDMGIPRFESADSYALALDAEQVTFDVVNMGNPHAVIVVDDVQQAEVERIGHKLSTHASFPAGINVGFMQVVSPTQIKLRVYERGTGPTQACGSGACAAMAVGRRLNLLEEAVTVEQPGGKLLITWVGGRQSLLMRGPAQTVYQGEWLE